MHCFVCFINIVWYAYDGCHLFMLSSYYHFVYCSVVVCFRLAVFLPLSCRHVIMSSLHFLVWLPWSFVVSLLCSAFNLSSCRPVVKSPCHHLFTQSSITISSSIYVWSSYQLAIMSLPPLVTIYTLYILLFCHLVILLLYCALSSGYLKLSCELVIHCANEDWNHVL